MQLQQIDYAPTLPSHRRRRLVRRITLGVIALVLVALAIKSAPSARRHVQILYWQHRAMTYTVPEDQVVYDNDPADAAKLRASNASLIVGTNGELLDFAKPWERLYQLMSPPGRKPSATLFLHEMRNSKGERRLVVVEFWTSNSTFYSDVIAPGGMTRDPVEQLDLVDGLVNLPEWHAVFPKMPRQRVSILWYAGQVDLHDPSHFTIRGMRDAKRFQVNGWLRDEVVELSESP